MAEHKWSCIVPDSKARGDEPIVIQEEDGTPVATLDYINGDELEVGRLIAAAPIMYEWLEKAAQMAEQQYAGGSDTPMSSAWHWLAENARTAIDQAGKEA